MNIESKIGNSDILLDNNWVIINENHEVLDNLYAQMVQDLLEYRW